MNVSMMSLNRLDDLEKIVRQHPDKKIKLASIERIGSKNGRYTFVSKMRSPELAFFSFYNDEMGPNIFTEGPNLKDDEILVIISEEHYPELFNDAMKYLENLARN